MKKKKILAVASQGGHLIQLLRMKPVFDRYDTSYVSNVSSLNCVKINKVIDANFNQKFRLFLLAIQILFVMFKVRPEIVITTGAAPGFFAVLWGRLFFTKTIWVDSVANAEELSLAGKKARILAHVCLSQWEDVANKEGVGYIGSVL